MKKLLLLLPFYLFLLPAFAQSPELFNYQGVARDAGGNVLANQNIGLQIDIRQSTSTGIVVYSETHAATTNAFGLFNVKIGGGTPQLGTLGGIDWANGPYFSEVSLDATGGTSYQSMGVSQLLSVPYALYAENSGTPGPQGPAGADGVDGAVGPQGPQGPAGADGIDGAVGPQGPQGPAGADGVDGAVGPQGPQGSAGVDGVDGAVGPQGPQGPAGADGVDGAVGPQGPAGLTGPIGPQGPAGADGIDGAVGPQGPAGPAGADGIDGAVGPQGPAGADGVDGAVGPQGPQGPQGPAGADGNDGATGATGPQGPQGPTGADGVDGAVGPQGPQGPIGATGLQGFPGPIGPQGPTGADGAGGTLDEAYDFGTAGAGREIIATDGAVSIAGQDGFQVTGTFGSGDDILLSGVGTRMFFNPKKAAFRAGGTTDEWDNANVGEYSVAMGYRTEASGFRSVAMGESTNASGSYSTALGSSSVASGWYSVGLGYRVKALSHAEIVVGTFSTDYTPSSVNNWNAADRLFVIGNGSGCCSQSSNAMVVLKNGNTAIGNINPTTKLDVDGQLRLRGGSPAVGKVLTSDANGLATWETVAPASGTLDEAYDFGGAGAGREIIATDGAVSIAGQDGFQVTGTFGSGDDILLSGVGTRMFFNPKKAAFRAGGTAGEWDNANVGDYSVAMGLETEASGDQSFAMGRQSIASGDRSVATGFRTRASGVTSTAFGANTTASGLNSFATGSNTTASGKESFTTGVSTIASGPHSTAMGAGTKARSFAETVVGLYSADYTPASTCCIVSSDRVFVIGNGAESSLPSNAMVVLKNGNTAIGNINPTTKLDVDGQLRLRGGSPGAGKVLTSDANGLATWQTVSAGVTLDEAYDFGAAGAGREIIATDGALKVTGEDGFLVIGTFGAGNTTEVSGAGTRMFFNPNKAAFRAGRVTGTQWNNSSIGEHSIAIGYNTTASGNESFAVGSQTTASGFASVATGDRTTASGTYATATGIQTVASGLASSAMGFDTEASGAYSITTGRLTTASGNYSTAMGYNTAGKSFGETAFGLYTTDYTPASTTSWNATDRLFVIGNGTSSSRSDAMVVLKNGNTGIGTSAPAVGLHVTKGNDASLSDGSGFFMIGNESGGNILMDSNELMARNNGGLSPLYIQNEGNSNDGGVSIGQGSAPAYLLQVNGSAGKPGGGSWIATSDKRLKQEIQPYTDGLEQLLAIKPVTYHYNETSGFDTKPEYVGVLAQDLKEVAPYMVGTFDKEGTEYYDVDNSAMTYMLINSVKELKESMDELREQNKQLKKEIELLKRK